jgi:hypothetical protein
MAILVALIGLGLFWGGYWLGWNDRKWKAIEDENFRKLDVILEKLGGEEGHLIHHTGKGFKGAHEFKPVAAPSVSREPAKKLKIDMSDGCGDTHHLEIPIPEGMSIPVSRETNAPQCKKHPLGKLPEGKGLWEVCHVGCEYPHGDCSCYCGINCEPSVTSATARCIEHNFDALGRCVRQGCNAMTKDARERMKLTDPVGEAFNYHGVPEAAPLSGEGGERNASYLYSFYVWPNETRKDIPKEVFDLFKNLNSRLEYSFLPIEFVRWRMEVEAFGLTLREITRVPDCKPEVIL